MLTEIYIDALLVDEELADLVWEAWNDGKISDDIAAWAWWSIGRTGPIYTPSVILCSCNVKAKPAERRGRKATGPRFLREATEDLPKDPKTAELPQTGNWLIASCRERNKLGVSHEFLDQTFISTDGRYVYLRNADAGHHLGTALR